jgi:hypothetical protein
VNTDSQKSTSTNNTSQQSSSEGWSGAQLQFYQAEEMKKWIMLDNGSTFSLFCNPDLVENIRETSETLQLSTNGGELSTN